MQTQEQVLKQFCVLLVTSQKEASAKEKIKNEAFQHKRTTDWTYFENILQKYFLLEIQSTDYPINRRLSPQEFRCLQQRFCKEPEYITLEEYENLWQWFEVIIQLLCSHKDIRVLWERGVISGIMSEKLVERYLEGKPTSTCMICFADERGMLQIAVVTNRGIENYFVSFQKISGLIFSDVLYYEVEWVARVLQLIVHPTHNNNNNNNNNNHFELREKEEALEGLITHYDERMTSD